MLTTSAAFLTTVPPVPSIANYTEPASYVFWLCGFGFYFTAIAVAVSGMVVLNGLDPRTALTVGSPLIHEDWSFLTRSQLFGGTRFQIYAFLIVASSPTISVVLANTCIMLGIIFPFELALHVLKKFLQGFCFPFGAMGVPDYLDMVPLYSLS